jgi:cell division protein DivIC
MRRTKKRGTGVGIIALVVLILFAIVTYSRVGLQDRYDEAQITNDRLNAQIEEQEERALDISNMKAYVQTKQYIEDIAREKLGLVYKDEIIFEEDDEN